MNWRKKPIWFPTSKYGLRKPSKEHENDTASESEEEDPADEVKADPNTDSNKNKNKKRKITKIEKYKAKYQQQRKDLYDNLTIEASEEVQQMLSWHQCQLKIALFKRFWVETPTAIWAAGYLNYYWREIGWDALQIVTMNDFDFGEKYKEEQKTFQEDCFDKIQLNDIKAQARKYAI